MTNLDLPPISFARYVELLKRRKWQVVPVSLLGMIVGGLIAASVPRYYVASTDVHFNAEHFLSEEKRHLAEPLEEIIASAPRKLEALVPDVLRQLGWQEALVDDGDERAEFVAAVAARTRINDVGAPVKGASRNTRSNTDLRITYSDTDGERAAAFANTLREQWIAKQMGELERRAVAEVQRVQEEHRDAESHFYDIEREIAGFETKHKIDPSLRGNNLLALDRSPYVKLQEDRDREANLVLELSGIEIEIGRLEQRLETDVPQLVEAPPPTLDPILQAELMQLRMQYLGYSTQRKSFRPGSDPHNNCTRQMEEIEALLQAKTPVPPQKKVPNPEYRALRDDIDAKKAARDARQRMIDDLGKRIAATEAELALRPRLAQDYNELWAARDKAVARLAAKQVDLDRLIARVQEVRAAQPFDTLLEARVPPRPTEPNITVLALIGSLIGLGVAVGLIFAFDALRFTYKTLEDLERGLPVPVLGGISHVETHVERSQTRRGRLVVSGLALSLLFLIVAVTTLYYVVPARLPAWAHDILDMVLGSG